MSPVPSAPTKYVSPPVKLAVLGPGGVGGLLAAVLPHALVVSRERLTEIRLRSVILGDRTTPVRSVQTLIEPTDVLFIATKEHVFAIAPDKGGEAAAAGGGGGKWLVVTRFSGLCALQTR